MSEPTQPAGQPALAPPPRPLFTWRYGVSGGLLLAMLACVFSNRVPFWQSMTVLMGLVACGTAALLHRAGQPIVKPRLFDTLLGLALAGASWGAVTLFLRLSHPYVPQFASGLALVAGYASAQDPLWRYAGVMVIAPAEELFWRRYVPFLVEGWWGPRSVRAQAIAVGAYASLHLFSGTVWLALPALAFGALWAGLTLYRRDPWAAIVWHVAFDLIVFIWAPPAP